MKKHCYTLLVFVFSISSFAQSNTFIDKRDGKVYKTVRIGLQTWIAENLAFKADSNCWAYDNDQSFVAKYGYLYNWQTAKTVCPTGWHLPNKEEFETLLNNCGGSGKEAYKALFPGGSSGFSARFGGYGTYYSGFYEIGERADFWSSSSEEARSYEEEETGELYYYESVSNLEFNGYSSTAYISAGYSSSNWSVRCLKDN